MERHNRIQRITVDMQHDIYNNTRPAERLALAKKRKKEQEPCPD